jgi:MinD-like ATPase involved in chromosome partitioning or flagellar assembly
VSPVAGVLCAVTGALEAPLVRALGESARLEVTRRCADLAELLAAAAAGLGRVAVVSAGLPGLDRAAIEHLRTSGVRVLGLGDPDWPIDHVRHLGVDAAARHDDPVVAIVAEVHRLLEGDHEPLGVVPPAAASTEDHPRNPSPADGSVPTGDPGPGGADRGRLVAVWGPTGAPGRSTVALTLAHELAEATRRGGAGPVLVVDADTYGGTIAQLLGMLDEAPGIAAAARAAATGRLDGVGLAALTPALDNGLRVLTGISRAARWPELPAAHLAVVWSAARELAAWTVVDCGFCLEQDEALSYDTRAPQRNAATLSALAEADLVVVVGRGDPIGLQRLVRGLGDLDDLGVPAVRRRVVVNRVRASASGPRPRQVVRDALRRYAGVDVHVVPDDPSGCDGAVLAARTLTEHAPASPARRALAELASELLSLDVPAGAH